MATTATPLLPKEYLEYTSWARVRVASHYDPSLLTRSIAVTVAPFETAYGGIFYTSDDRNPLPIQNSNIWGLYVTVDDLALFTQSDENSLFKAVIEYFPATLYHSPDMMTWRSVPVRKILMNSLIVVGLKVL